MAIPRRRRLLKALNSLDAWDLYSAIFTAIGGIRLVPVTNGTHLEQVLNYVGEGVTSKTAGRRFRSHTGIIGKAFTKNEVFWASRQKEHYTSFVAELQSEWGYMEEEARSLNPEIYSWLAMPLSGEDASEVIGILYLDANWSDFFDDDWILDVIMMASAGIVQFVQKRFPQ